jgi:hypothetical protein
MLVREKAKISDPYLCPYLYSSVAEHLLPVDVEDHRHAA